MGAATGARLWRRKTPSCVRLSATDIVTAGTGREPLRPYGPSSLRIPSRAQRTASCWAYKPILVPRIPAASAEMQEALTAVIQEALRIKLGVDFRSSRATLRAVRSGIRPDQWAAPG